MAKPEAHSYMCLEDESQSQLGFMYLKPMAHASFIIDTNQVYYLCLHTLWFLYLVLCLARFYAVMKSTHPNHPVKPFWIVSDFYWSSVFVFILFRAIGVLVTVKDNPLCWGTKEKEKKRKNCSFFLPIPLTTAWKSLFLNASLCLLVCVWLVMTGRVSELEWALLTGTVPTVLWPSE